MPRQENVLSVFVASPSDVVEERARLEEIVRDLNATWSRNFGIRLELIMWETHAFPGMGEDPQAVINDQVPNDYDIFIGILWSRYGTPTRRYESGTIEEFERAKARHKSDPSSVHIMVYFKDEPISPSKIDIAQLSAINLFRKFLDEALYFSFQSLGQFEDLTRLHLSRQVQAAHANLSAVRQAPDNQNAISEQTQHESDLLVDDLGFLDLMEIFEEKFSILSGAMENIGHATEKLNKNVTMRADDLTHIPAEIVDSAKRKLIRKTLLFLVEDLQQYSSRMELEIPIFQNSLSDGSRALIKSVALLADFSSQQDNQKDMGVIPLTQVSA